MKFADIVCFKAIVAELKAVDRNGVIGELIESLALAGQIEEKNCKKITKALIRRENEGSTGMGKGVAIPHLKSSSAKEVVVAVGRSSIGIDFNSLDKQPVHSIILLLSPADDSDKHLQAMESIFKHLQHDRFRKFLRQLDTAEKIEDLLREVDENPSLR